MCLGAEWPISTSSGGGGGDRGTKRRLVEVRERQINAVCVAIEHFRKRRRGGGGGEERAVSTQSFSSSTLPVLDGKPETEKIITASSDYDALTSTTQQRRHDESCRLCESTRRVLRVVKQHSGVPHDVQNCEACRMWSMVTVRYAYLRRVRTAAARGDLELSRVVAVE